MAAQLPFLPGIVALVYVSAVCVGVRSCLIAAAALIAIITSEKSKRPDTALKVLRILTPGRHPRDDSGESED